VSSGHQYGIAVLRFVNADGKEYLAIVTTKVTITSASLSWTPAGLLETFTVCMQDAADLHQAQVVIMLLWAVMECTLHIARSQKVCIFEL
jgi:hypothetical protein